MELLGADVGRLFNLENLHYNDLTSTILNIARNSLCREFLNYERLTYDERDLLFMDCFLTRCGGRGRRCGHEHLRFNPNLDTHNPSQLWQMLVGTGYVLGICYNTEPFQVSSRVHQRSRTAGSLTRN